MTPLPLVADHDRSSLAAWLAQATGRPVATARRTAAKAFRSAFAATMDHPWSDDGLRQCNIGRWARPELLRLSITPTLSVVEQASSSDGTLRLLWQAQDGELTESVIIPGPTRRERQRTTLCLSSQIGCARRCRFCESGRHGLRRQLSAAEIVDQVRLSRRLWQGGGHGDITNLVFMGMGEPLDNLATVLRAISLLTDIHAFDFAPTRITVSTVGIADHFPAFFAATRAQLAISLNAPDDERRQAIIPVAAHYDLASLRQALLEALPPRRGVLFQYALFSGFNDAPEDAEQLADFVEPVRCRLNVIAGNPGPDPTLRAPSLDRIEAFMARLHRRGIRTILRHARGVDVGGACGQLAGAHRRERQPPLAAPP